MFTVLEYKCSKTLVVNELTIRGKHANSDARRIKDRLL